MSNLRLDEEHKYRFRTDVFGTANTLDGKIQVEGKEHYKKLMLQGGFIPYEKAQEIAEENKPEHKGYKPSPELVSFLRCLKQSADKNGNIRLGGKAIQKMKEFGVNFDNQLPDHLKNIPLEGGVV